MGTTTGSRFSRFYFTVLNVLHRPFVRQSVGNPYHAAFVDFVELTKRTESPSMLELGSRDVSGGSRRDTFQHCKEYVGFDILPGDGVDIVGDAHMLSRSCPTDHFDFVYSLSVFEHLLFPWKVAIEINKVLKPGGHVFVATHPVWPAHELPWDFWRFPINGFRALFNEYTGFEIVTIAEGLPSKLYSLVWDRPTRGQFRQTLNQGVSLIARKTGDYRSDLLKWDIGTADILDTMYPPKKSQ